jgi:hypothetical protein
MTAAPHTGQRRYPVARGSDKLIIVRIVPEIQPKWTPVVRGGVANFSGGVQVAIAQ